MYCHDENNTRLIPRLVIRLLTTCVLKLPADHQKSCIFLYTHARWLNVRVGGRGAGFCLYHVLVVLLHCLPSTLSAKYPPGRAQIWYTAMYILTLVLANRTACLLQT